MPNIAQANQLTSEMGSLLREIARTKDYTPENAQRLKEIRQRIKELEKEIDTLDS
jgi:uncharacterized protein Yka (UPF0111/DUF47 family)